MAKMRAKHARLSAGSNVFGVQDSATKILRSEAAKRGAKTRAERKAKTEEAKAQGKAKAQARRRRRAIERTQKLKIMLRQGATIRGAARSLGIGAATAQRLLAA